MTPLSQHEQADAAFLRRLLFVFGAALALFLAFGGVFAWRSLGHVRALAERARAAPPATDWGALDTRSPDGAMVTRVATQHETPVVFLGPAHCAEGPSSVRARLPGGVRDTFWLGAGRAAPTGAWVAVLGARDGRENLSLRWLDARRLEARWLRWDKKRRAFVPEARTVEIALSEELATQIKGDAACSVPVLRHSVRGVDPVGLEYVSPELRPPPGALLQVKLR